MKKAVILLCIVFALIAAFFFFNPLNVGKAGYFFVTLKHDSSNYLNSNKEVCNDEKMLDEDKDGLANCIDPDCEKHASCISIEDTYALCRDGVDNNKNRLIDCEDTGCGVFAHCDSYISSEKESCELLEDSNNDGLSGCSDPNCINTEYCRQSLTGSSCNAEGAIKYSHLLYCCNGKITDVSGDDFNCGSCGNSCNGEPYDHYAERTYQVCYARQCIYTDQIKGDKSIPLSEYYAIRAQIRRISDDEGEAGQLVVGKLNRLLGLPKNTMMYEKEKLKDPLGNDPERDMTLHKILLRIN